MAARIEAFRQGLHELGYVKGKNIVIEWRSAEGNSIALVSLTAELVRLKVDIIVSGWSGINPRRQGSNYDDSHCHGAGWRSCWQRVRRQPCATWWNITGFSALYPELSGKRVELSEGDRSYALARGRPQDFDPSWQRTSVKRDRTRRRGVQ